MFKPPFWNHQNTRFPKKEIEQVISEYKNNIPLKSGNYSSFYPNHPHPESIWSKNYLNIIKDIMLNIGLETVTKYSYCLWGQLYVKGCNHLPHHHFRNDDDRYDISFVHFIQTVDEPLFQFLNLKEDKYIPINQKDGDIIVFPSWLWHSVMTNKSNKERFVVAGNIRINYMSCDP